MQKERKSKARETNNEIGTRERERKRNKCTKEWKSREEKNNVVCIKASK